MAAWLRGEVTRSYLAPSIFKAKGKFGNGNWYNNNTFLDNFKILFSYDGKETF